MIQVRGAVKAYGSTVVVDEVTLDLEPGGVTAIIGANGAGKSTLLSLIARLVGMDAGHILVDGLDVTSGSSKELARRLAILRQENHLTMRLTVRDLVTFGRFPHSGGRPGPDDLEMVERALGFLDLQELAGRYLDELSGGQRQRAYVAMVLAQDTPYLLLDEPLNNLDMLHSVEMMTLMRAAAADLGKSVVVVLHDINFASCYADRIIAMRDGRLVCQGTPDEVITTERLREVYDLEMSIHCLEGRRIAAFHTARPRTPAPSAQSAHSAQSAQSAQSSAPRAVSASPS